jgi:hypothetical protein
MISQPRIARALLQLAHVGAVDPRRIGKLLLRDALGVPQPAQIGGEGVPEVPRVHPRNGAGCRLQAHALKQLNPKAVLYLAFGSNA